MGSGRLSRYLRKKAKKLREESLTPEQKSFMELKKLHGQEMKREELECWVFGNDQGVSLLKKVHELEERLLSRGDYQTDDISLQRQIKEAKEAYRANREYQFLLKHQEMQYQNLMDAMKANTAVVP